MRWVKHAESNEWMCHECSKKLHEAVEVAFEVSTADKPKTVPSDQTFIVLSVFMPSQAAGRRFDNRDSLTIVVGDRPRFQMPVKLLYGQRYDMLLPIVVPPRADIALAAFSTIKIGERSRRADCDYVAFLCGFIRRDVA